MWREADRFMVNDEAGSTHVVVKMTKTMERRPLVGRRRAIPEVCFYFLLDGSNVSPLPDGTYRNDETGRTLSRVVDDVASDGA